MTLEIDIKLNEDLARYRRLVLKTFMFYEGMFLVGFGIIVGLDYYLNESDINIKGLLFLFVCFSIGAAGLAYNTCHPIKKDLLKKIPR